VFRVGSHAVDLLVGNSVAKLLGFKNAIYAPGVTYESENIVNIMKIMDWNFYSPKCDMK